MIGIVVTARASWAKWETVVEVLDTAGTPVTIYACGQAVLPDYGEVVKIIRARFPRIPVVEIWTHAEGTTPLTAAKAAGALTSDLASHFHRDKPDVVAVMADRSEVLAAAQAAAYLGITLAHVQGGERTGSIDDRVRDAITSLSDWHFPATKRASMRVYGITGHDPSRIIVSGCPSIDVCEAARHDPPITVKDLSGAGNPVDPAGRFALCLQHADTTSWKDAYQQMMATLFALESVNIPVLIQWPNADAGGEGIAKAIRVFRNDHPAVAFHTLPNMPPRRFLRLMLQAKVLVGNSSCGIRESSFLGVPSVTIGDRQQGRERAANVISVPYKEAAIAAAILQQIAHGPYRSSTLYGHGRAGQLIATKLQEIAHAS